MANGVSEGCGGGGSKVLREGREMRLRVLKVGDYTISLKAGWGYHIEGAMFSLPLGKYPS